LQKKLLKKNVYVDSFVEGIIEECGGKKDMFFYTIDEELRF
jgi:hypothetical protein